MGKSGMIRVALLLLWGVVELPLLQAQASTLLDLAGSGTAAQVQ
jgi:hypothetical protein